MNFGLYLIHLPRILWWKYEGMIQFLSGFSYLLTSVSPNPLLKRSNHLSYHILGRQNALPPFLSKFIISSTCYSNLHPHKKFNWIPLHLHKKLKHR